MSTMNVDFSELMSVMAESLQRDLESGALVAAPMCEYTFRFTEMYTETTCIFTVDHRRDVSEEELNEFATKEFVMDLYSADIEVDKSETLDKHGKLQFPDCFRVKFTMEDGIEFVFDGIPDEGVEDQGEDFCDRIMPIISSQVHLGSFILLETVEYED